MTIDLAQRYDRLLWITIVRILIQFVLIRWAWIYTK
jgi:hypothetical protein